MPTADMVLNTSDNVKFHVHRSIVSVASPFWHSTFRMYKSDRFPTEWNIPTNSATLDCYLRMVYPVEQPVITQPTVAVDVWSFARTLQTTMVEKAMAVLIHSLPLPGNELELFAAACRMDDEDLTSKAIRAWIATAWKDAVVPSKYSFLDCLKHFNFAYVPGMATVSAGAYYRLLRFAASSEVQRADFTFTRPAATSSSPQGEDSAKAVNVPRSADPSLPPPDVIIRSSDGVDISAHKLLLQLAGAGSLMVGEDLRTSQPKAKAKAKAKVLTTYQARLPTRQLQRLIDLCYPSTMHNPRDVRLSEIAALVRASREPAHQLPKHEFLLKQHLAAFVVDEPLRTYFAADSLGWADIAERAARATMAMDFDQLYTPDMEQAPASSFYKLLCFHHCCWLAVTSISSGSENSEHSAASDPAQLSMPSLVGISSPFGIISTSLAAQYQPLTTEVGTRVPPDPKLCEALERNLKQLRDEVEEHKREIHRALNNVSIPVTTILNDCTSLIGN